MLFSTPEKVDYALIIIDLIIIKICDYGQLMQLELFDFFSVLTVCLLSSPLFWADPFWPLLCLQKF